jgi:hypothetical protein
MQSWQWECFDRVLSGPNFLMSDSGPLVAPVRSFSAHRDPKGRLVLETVAAGDLRHPNPEPTPGLVHKVTATVEFKARTGGRATAFAVTPGDRSESWNADRIPECHETSHLGAIEIFVRPGPAAYVFDWLENVDHQSMIWMGEMIRDRTTPGETRRIGNGEAAILLKGGGNRNGSHRGALELHVGGHELFLCAAFDIETRTRPGYILYRGVPDDTTRRKIRNAIGFALGVGFVYLGSTAINAASELVSTYAMSSQNFGERIFDHYALPPAPLSGPGQDMVDQKVLSRVADAIYAHYDDMDFDSLSWAYWHAVCAPLHMKAAHFGSAIEAVQAAYMKAHPNSGRTKLIADATLAKLVAKRLKDSIADLEFDSAVAKALDDKLAGINKASGVAVSDRLFDELGLRLGDDERAAWQRRNHAAHGRPLTQEDSVPLVRDTNLLRILLNRLVLKIAGASPTYLDTYTVGWGLRALGQPVPSTPSTPPA